MKRKSQKVKFDKLDKEKLNEIRGGEEMNKLEPVPTKIDVPDPPTELKPV